MTPGLLCMEQSIDGARMIRSPQVLPLTTLLAFGVGSAAYSEVASTILKAALDCGSSTGYLCTDVLDSVGYNGGYTGHDEPSVLFYSNVPGSGNSSVYLIRLPKDPPVLPTQDGKGGTFNFQLHPAFFVGMVLCDDQSAPNPGGSPVSPNIRCVPDSDRNIFDGTNPAKAEYIGRHPGAAFMEMQFYPPGWFQGSGDPIRWVSALNIDSLSLNQNTFTPNNAACRAVTGPEPVNFAFITKSGVPLGPPSPLLQTNATFTLGGDALFYNPGDLLRVTLSDTVHGLKITIDDLTSGESGSMTSSAANGFAQVLFDPAGKDCNAATHSIPADYHPAYSTSSEHTRVPWSAHSFNIAFSDEVGHFEYCNAVDPQGNCTQDGVGDRDDGSPAGTEDDTGCFDANAAGAAGLIAIGGCTAGDIDFDGVPYQLTWPGTQKNPVQDARLHPQPIRFTSPVFLDELGRKRNYSRVAFEANLPRIEGFTSPPCQPNLSNPADTHPGQGCVNPAVNSQFYPFFSTFVEGWEESPASDTVIGQPAAVTADRGDDRRCFWQLGGAHIPGTRDLFGGSSTAEYGPLLALGYAAAGGKPTEKFNDFRRILDFNPCASNLDRDP
jgi:hypothetical protein